jgi:WXG100 family type VII secretion target
MLKVDFGALDAAAADISTRAGQIEARLAQMDQELAPLRADWTGAASEAYQGAKAAWTEAIAEMRQVLGRLGSAVHQSNAAYLAGERLNANRW